MKKMKKIKNLIRLFAILSVLFFGFNACKKKGIDYAKLKADEIVQREQYLDYMYDTLHITEDGITYIAIVENGDTIMPTYLGEYSTIGMYYIDKTPEDRILGVKPTPGRLVEVKFTGYLLDGTVFDTSDSSSTGTFHMVYGVGKVITGWDEGLSYMNKGSIARLIIPSDLAYGQYGSEDIPSYSTLVFDIEIVNAQK